MTKLVWHPNLIRFLKDFTPQKRIRVLEDLNNGNWHRKPPNDDLKTGYIWTTFRQLADDNTFNEWTGGDEWEQFDGYLDDDTITKPLNGYFDEKEECWYVTHDEIRYYVMTYLMLEIEQYQSINFKVTTLGKSL